jgi:hypothetical protein
MTWPVPKNKANCHAINHYPVTLKGFLFLGGKIETLAFSKLNIQGSSP